MGATASLADSSIAVEPGGRAQTQLRVLNTGQVVDQFTFQPLGDGAGWITVEPPQMSLFPGAEEVAVVTIAPPRESTTPAGPTSIGVRALSQEDPSESFVVEAVVDVAGFSEVGAELVPVTASGRLAGRFDLALDNRGNVPVSARLYGTDPEEALKFAFKPDAVSAEPGTAKFAKVRARPKKKMFRGAAKTKPFQLVVESSGEPAPAPVAIAGTLVQEPIMPPWLLKAVLAAVAAGIALFALWQTVLKPSVESTAREIADEEIIDAFNAANIPLPSDAFDDPDVEPVDGDAEPVDGDAEPIDGDAEPVGGPVTELGTPTNFRLGVATAEGSTARVSNLIATDTLFSLTDLILQNPQGDLGIMRILADGAIVFESALDNFRDLDFHFVAPYQFGADTSLEVEVFCEAAGPGFGQCSAAASFAGFESTPASRAVAGSLAGG